MQLDIEYGQAVEVAKSVLSSDYKALLEGLFQFDSVEEERGLIDAYATVMRWYNGWEAVQ